MKKKIVLILTMLICGYTASYGQTKTTKQDTTSNSSLGEKYDKLGKDIKETSTATWDETKKTSKKAWKATKNATGDALDKVGEWSKNSSKKLKK